MTNATWHFLKLPLAVLQSPTYGRLSDRLYRRATELRLVAGRENAGGILPPIQDVAWTLHLDAEALQEDFLLLEEVGILDRVGETWRFASFERDQLPSDPTAAERMRRYRAKQDAERNVTRNVTRELRVETDVEVEREKDTDAPVGAVVRVSSQPTILEDWQERLAYAKSRGARRPEAYARSLPPGWKALALDPWEDDRRRYVEGSFADYIEGDAPAAPPQAVSLDAIVGLLGV